MIPTRWRTAIEDQLADARARLKRATSHLESDDGGRALQETYPAVVAAATVRVWLDAPPWTQLLSADEMRRRVRITLPGLFAALAEMDLQQVLTSPWRTADARPYIAEADRFVAGVEQQVTAWLEQS